MRSERLGVTASEQTIVKENNYKTLHLTVLSCVILLLVHVVF